MDEKIGNHLIALMQVLLLVMVIHGFFFGYPSNLGRLANFSLGLCALCVTLIPFYINRRIQLDIPWHITFLVIFSIYFHIAGGAYGWYFDFYPYYDKIAHFISSCTVALVGLEYIHMVGGCSRFNLTRYRLPVVIFLFTISMGIFWEMGEFALDRIFSTDFQYSTQDTMLDLTFDLLGALTIALFGEIYLFRRSKTRIGRTFARAIPE